MAIMHGLKEMDKVINRPDYPERQKVEWLKMDNRESVTARFINELSEDSPNYSPERPLAIVVLEHSNPKEYWRKAICTKEDEGRCFGCEMAEREGKGSKWRGKYRYYTNLLVKQGNEPAKVVVWSQGIYKQSAFNTIKEYAIDTGSITNREWKITRSGEGTDTVYTLVARDPDTEKFDWDGVEPYDLDAVVRQVPYAEQESFYLGFDKAGAEPTDTNMEWE